MRQGARLCGILLGLVVSATAWGQQATLSIKVSQPGVKVSPTLYGIFFEEINRAGEGGLYGEHAAEPVVRGHVRSGRMDAGRQRRCEVRHGAGPRTGR